MRVDEVQSRRRAEVAEQARLHVLGPQRLAQQRVVEQVDLADREIVRRTPVRVDQAQLLLGQRHGLGAGAFSKMTSRLRVS